MHQGDQPTRGRERLRFRGEHPEGEAVDHDRALAGKLGDAPLRRGTRRRGGARKALADVEHLHVPAGGAQLRDDAPVIGVAAGRCRKIARHHEHDLLHHNGASCQALAEGDSKTVIADRRDLVPVASELAGPRHRGELIEHVFGHEFGGGVDALELRQVVEIAVVERRQRGFERRVRAADIDDDAVSIQLLGHEGGADHEGRAVQLLGGTEHLALEGMRDHDLVGNFDCEHRNLSINVLLFGARIADQRAARVGLRPENLRQSLRQVLERHRRRQQASSAGSTRRSSAAARRRARLQRGRCEGATWPTWLETSRSRRL